ncbi:hypothetical protein L1987_83649 [Smallanthus sonchifolius]|uniref:Uncharacterized protein n=1 Tax=Smallanthus sonchifolius TaxID=185202 RepID=A0ACB8YE02_9ASTR|nr:hypothetical protein L1987_83649 [Smallanthus sonchifolius]
MRCKKHYTDLSSTIGVCACCLRERLLSLLTAEQQVQSQIQNSDGKHRNSENNPAFHRSVSPHFNSRKSDQSAGAAARSDDTRRKDHDRRPYPLAAPRHHHSQSDQLFYQMPHGGPATGGDSKKKRSFIRLFSFTNIFRSRNRKPVDSVTVTDPRAPDSTFGESRGGINATSSSSWFSGIISGRRRRRKQTVCIDESRTTAGGGPVRRQQCRDRGMSPVRNADVVSGDEDEFRNTTGGYESTESWKNTPRRTPVVRRGGSGGHVRNISGLTFCLSPLVRASPNLQWNQKGLPPDVVLSGEIGAPVKPHLSNAKSFCANRSRKLADFGRPNLNR